MTVKAKFYVTSVKVKIWNLRTNAAEYFPVTIRKGW